MIIHIVRSQVNKGIFRRPVFSCDLYDQTDIQMEFAIESTVGENMLPRVPLYNLISQTLRLRSEVMLEEQVVVHDLIHVIKLRYLAEG